MKLLLTGAVALAGCCLAACADEPRPIYYAPSPPPPPVRAAVRIYAAPPPLPVYDQPPLPGPGYIWTPGYWAWSAAAGDYYWVPGAWVLAPEPGLLWTPAWWGWSNGAYIFHGGYWGPHVGFYGGIAYGFGYTGVGYQGGYWSGGSFFYNRAVNHITNVVNVTNVYNQTIINRVNVNATRVSYNGGPNGVTAAPSPQERAAASERRVAPTAVQAQARSFAAHQPQAFVSANRGRPPAEMLSRAAPQGRAGSDAVAHLPRLNQAPGGFSARTAPEPSFGAQTRSPPAPSADPPYGGAGSYGEAFQPCRAVPPGPLRPPGAASGYASDSAQMRGAPPRVPARSRPPAPRKPEPKPRSGDRR